jgi:hypothetical protein
MKMIPLFLFTLRPTHSYSETSWAQSAHQTETTFYGLYPATLCPSRALSSPACPRAIAVRSDRSCFPHGHSGIPDMVLENTH